MVKRLCVFSLALAFMSLSLSAKAVMLSNTLEAEFMALESEGGLVTFNIYMSISEERSYAGSSCGIFPYRDQYYTVRATRVPNGFSLSCTPISHFYSNGNAMGSPFSMSPGAVIIPGGLWNWGYYVNHTEVQRSVPGVLGAYSAFSITLSSPMQLPLCTGYTGTVKVQLM